MKPKPHVSEEKKKELVSIVKLMQEYPVVGLIDLTGLPSAQYQSIRAKLKSRLLIKSTALSTSSLGKAITSRLPVEVPLGAQPTPSLLPLLTTTFIVSSFLEFNIFLAQTSLISI